MRVVRFPTSQAFGERVLPFLLSAEAENCFFIGFISRLKSDDVYVAVENAAGDVVAVAIKTPDRHVGLTPTSNDAVDALVNYFLEQSIDPIGVQSRPAPARHFAQRYSDYANRKSHLEVSMAIHQLDQVTPVHGVEGSFRAATDADVELLVDWSNAFATECHMPPIADPAAVARERIGWGRTYFWCVDDRAVSMASATGPTPHGIRVNLVYTPPELRGRGYASACVAAVSQRMLDSGRKFCFLYTDLGNPTSNKIYHSIGYRRVADSDQYLFEPAS